MNEKIMAGFAVSDITPPVGTELCGFGKYRERKSTGIIENLCARVFAWQSGERRGAIIVCDLIGVSSDITRDVRSILKRELNIPPENVAVAGTHTHSGPATVKLIGWGEKNPEYLKTLPERIASAAVAAAGQLTDAEFEYGEAYVDGISYNRDGGDLTDHTVKMLKVICGGKCAGFLYNYSCHPVVMCENTSLISGDFVGFATNALSEKTDACGIFMQGSLGDQNSVYCHKPQDESVENLKKLSALFMRAAESAYEAAEPFAADKIVSVLKKIDLPQVAPDKIDIIRHLELLDMISENENSFDERERRHFKFEKTAYGEILGRFNIETINSYETEIQAVKIGGLYMLCQPSELYYRYHREIERRMPDSKVFVVGFANDYAGYIATPDKYTLDNGKKYSYSAYLVPLIRGEFRYADNAGDVLADGLLEAAKEYEKMKIHL